MNFIQVIQCIFKITSPFFFTLLILLGFSPKAFSGQTNDDITQQVDFILEVANHINKKNVPNQPYYTIGLYGKGNQFRKITKSLEKKTADMVIHHKPVKIVQFNRLKKITDVDLLILSGERKIKPNELEDILNDLNYIVLTEHYPFGVSAMNYAFDSEDNLIYEIQESALKDKGYSVDQTLLQNKNRIVSSQVWKARLKQAERVIESQNKAIDTKEKIIQENEAEIGLHKRMIDDQHQEINEKSKTISNQTILLTLSIAASLIIGTLLIFLLRINAQRKLAIQEVRTHHKHILHSLDYAQKLQNALLPKTSAFKERFNHFFVCYRPKDIVSGDFYWMESVNEITYFAVADCTGHGVPGAMMSVICSKVLTKAVKEKGIFEPSKILDDSVDEISAYFTKSDVTINDGMDICLIRIDRKNNELTYAGANNPLYYFEEEATLKILKPDKQPVGAYDYRRPFTQQVLNLDTIKRAYLFSDGYTDQFGGDQNKKYSKKRFRSLLNDIQNQDMEMQFNTIQSTLEEWQGKAEQIDDICVVGIEF